MAPNPDRPICGARTRAGHPCPVSPMKGQKRCRKHGGSSPQAKAAAQIRLAEEQLTATARRLVGHPADNPLEALQDLAAEVVEWKTRLAAMVDELPTLSSGQSPQHVRGVVTAYERALDRCSRVLEGIARLGLDERLTRIREAKVERVVRAVDAALEAAGVTDPDTINTARQAAGRVLLDKA